MSSNVGVITKVISSRNMWVAIILYKKMAMFIFSLFIKISVSKGKQIDRKMDEWIVYSSLSVWEQQHAWPSAPPAPNFLRRRPPARIRPPIPYCVYFCSSAGLDIGLGSRPGRCRVGLRSVEPFHYKLLPWSWLKWHWRADWLLWRSMLMCCLIFPRFSEAMNTE